MQYKSSSFTWAVVTLISLSLGAGVALAMQTESRSVPAGNQFQVTAELTPGHLGAFVRGTGTSEDDPGDNEVDFSIVFDAGGTISLNGESGPAYVEDHIYIVTVDALCSQGVWTADIEVIDVISGTTVLYEGGVVLADKPDTIVAEGLSIARLIVSP